MSTPSPQVQNFRDYRDYLADWFRASKTLNRQMSFRYVAKRLGLKSPNHFHLVITKQRHLSRPTLEKMHKILRLRTKERAFLDLLHTQAVEKKDAERQQELQAKIDRLSAELADRPAEETPSESISFVANALAWYLKGGALRFSGKTATEIVDEVQRSVKFAVTPQDVHAALAVLQRVNAVTVDGEVYNFDFHAVKTDWDFDDEKIKRFHENNLNLATQAIQWPIDQRFLSNVTIACNQEIYDQAKKEIRDLCLKLLNLSSAAMTTPSECTQVVSLQFAMFPYFKW